MKDLDMIKIMNKVTLEEDPVRRAMEELEMDFEAPVGNGEEDYSNPFGDDSDDMGFDETGENDPDYEMGDEEELQKLAGQLMDDAERMDDEELLDKIGNDLEELEYSPDEIDDLAPRVLDMIREPDEEMGTEDEPDEEGMGDEEFEGNMDDEGEPGLDEPF